jgi:hypothetical protein
MVTKHLLGVLTNPRVVNTQISKSGRSKADSRCNGFINGSDVCRPRHADQCVFSTIFHAVNHAPTGAISIWVRPGKWKRTLRRTKANALTERTEQDI